MPIRTPHRSFLVSLLLPLAACASTGSTTPLFDPSLPEEGASRAIDRLALTGGRMQLSGDLSPVDEVNSIGIEASSDSAFGTFGWEFGILRGDDDFSASDSVSGERVQGDLSLTEIYGGARKTFDLQAVKAHVGLGLSYVNLDVDAQRSLPGGGGGGASPFNVQSLQDGSIGAYAQAGLSVPIGSAFTVGLTGRVRGGEDFEDGGNSVGSAISSFALRFSVRR